MDPNTIAYRWARFQDMLEELETTEQDFDEEAVMQNDRVAALAESANRGFSIGDEANDDWLDDGQ